MILNLFDREVIKMNEKINPKKKKYEPIEIDVRVVDGADVITTSSPVVVSEHDNAYMSFRFFE